MEDPAARYEGVEGVAAAETGIPIIMAATKTAVKIKMLFLLIRIIKSSIAYYT